MERRVRGNLHARCGTGEKAKMISKLYLSLYKIREQSDTYLLCNWCKVFFGKIVIQKVTAYEFYDSAVKRVPKFRIKRPLISFDRQFQWTMAKQNYDVAHGSIRPHLLIYINKSKYNTRIFKEVLSGETNT